ncbi:MAG: polyprenyl synthetase family protein [Bacillota bacterium]
MIKNIIEEKSKKFEEIIQDFFKQRQQLYPKELYETMEYAVFSGGKRIRPALMWLSAEFLGIKWEKVKDFAVALELIHSYSLIHDDLPCMDDDDFRRGKPSCHKKYGEALAVLAGDALLNLAYETILKSLKEDNKLYISAVYLSKCAGPEGMIGGQAEDILMKDVSEERILSIYRKKTSGLIKAAVVVPCYLHKNDPVFKDLDLYGEKLGLIFQLTDDILDQKQNEISYLRKTDKEKTINKINSLNKEINSIMEKYGEKAKDLLLFADFVSQRKN